MDFGSKFVYLGNEQEDDEEVKVAEVDDVVLSDSDVSDDDGETCVLDILDTAGQEEYSSLKDQYVRDGDGFVIIYSIVDESSFKEAEAVFRWLKRLRDENCHVILVANKQDLKSDAKVSNQDGKDLADKLGVSFFETSAKDGSGIVDAMKGLVRIIPRTGSDYKIVMLGSGAVGKSSITLRFVNNVFVDDYDPTIEDSYRKMISIDGLSAVSKDTRKAAKKAKKSKKAAGKRDSSYSPPVQRRAATAASRTRTDTKGKRKSGGIVSSLFGSIRSAVGRPQSAQARPSHGLFGSTLNPFPSSNNAIPGSPFLFSNANSNVMPQQQQVPSFGGYQQQQQQPMQSLFGQPQQQQQQPMQSLFGQPQQQQQPMQSLFGQPQQQQQPMQSLFGQPQQQQPMQSLFGQPQQQQQQQQPMQSIFGQSQSYSLQQSTTSNSNSLFGAPPPPPPVPFTFGNAAPPPPPQMQQAPVSDPSARCFNAPPQASPASLVKKEKKTDGNVVLIAMRQLDEDPKLVTGDAIRCKNCEAILTSTAVLEADGDKKIWNCEFCGHANRDLDIADDEIPKGDCLDYMLSPATEPEVGEDAAAAEDCKKQKTTPGVIVYCMDISSSMAALCDIPESQSSWRQERLGVADSNRVSRLECIQTAVERLVEQLKDEQPEKQILLVVFGSQVYVKAGGATDNLPSFSNIDNDTFNQLLEKGVRLCDNYALKPLADSFEEVKEVVKALRTTGCTALGPALSICLGFASAIPSSEIVLCTDGEPNVGVGTIRGNEAAAFYQQVGTHARSKNVTINILAVEGASCGLQSVSAAAEHSGGTTNKLNPAEIVRQLRSIAQNEVVATSVTVRFLLHPEFVFDEPEYGANLSQLEKEVGSARLETDLTFRFKLRDPTKKMEIKSVPFQVQIQYTRKNGMKCLRVLSKRNEATSSRQEMEQNISASVMSVSAMKTTAQLAKTGKGKEAQHMLKNVKRMVNRGARTGEQKEARLAFNSEVEAWDDHLTFKNTEFNAPQQMQSDMATNMIQQANLMNAQRSDTGANKLRKAMGRKKMGSTSKAAYYGYKNDLM